MDGLLSLAGRCAGACLLGVALDKEGDEEIGERGQVDAVGDGGKDLAIVAEAARGAAVQADKQV